MALILVLGCPTDNRLPSPQRPGHDVVAAAVDPIPLHTIPPAPQTQRKAIPKYGAAGTQFRILPRPLDRSGSKGGKLQAIPGIALGVLRSLLMPHRTAVPLPAGHCPPLR